MKKALVFGTILVAALSFATLAGPTVGVGLGWFGGDSWIAPTVGTRLNNVGTWGCNLNFAIGELNFVSGDNWSATAGTFTDLTVSYKVLHEAFTSATDPESIPVDIYVEAGIGTPAQIGMNADGFVFTGMQVGLVVGGGVQWASGPGLEALVYINEDNVGVGVQLYYDWFVGARWQPKS